MIFELATFNLAIPIAAGIATYLLAHVLMRSPEWVSLRRRRGSH